MYGYNQQSILNIFHIIHHVPPPSTFNTIYSLCEDILFGLYNKNDHPSHLPVRSSRFAMYYPVVKCYTKLRAIDVALMGDMRLAHLLVDFGFTC